MSPAGKRLILFLSVLVVLLGAARVLSGGRSRSGSHFGWMESESKGTEGEGASSPDTGGFAAGANRASPGGPASVPASTGLAATGSTTASAGPNGSAPAGAGSGGSTVDPGASSHDASPGAPAASSPGGKASGGGTDGKPSSDTPPSPAAGSKATPPDDEHDQADSRADEEAGTGRAGANADRPSSNQIDAADLSSAAFHVAAARGQASGDLRLSHDNGAFFIRYACQPYPSRDCTCPQLEKPVDEAQVNELLHLMQTAPHGPADALLTADLGLRDGSSRALSLNVARSPLPEIFDIHCQ